jgi:ABC-type protease/lipase transport system fused ATPase/permease subunit
MILTLPQGYDTVIRSDGGQPSAGQRQRIALARAAYRDPFLIVLDEPNSNLDAEGEAALANAIRGFRARGAAVVVIAHRPGVLDAVNLILALHEGRVRAFGPKNEVLTKLFGKPPASAAPVVAPGGTVQ